MIEIRSPFKHLALIAILLFAIPGALRAGNGQEADDIAHFLAGLTPSADSPLAALSNDAGWKKHAAFFESSWKALDERQLSRVREWSEQNIKQPQPVLFYMFSGPDF